MTAATFGLTVALIFVAILSVGIIVTMRLDTDLDKERDKPRFVSVDGTDTTPASTNAYFMELWTLRDEAAILRSTVTQLELELVKAKIERNIDRTKAELFDNLAAAIKGTDTP